MVRCFQALHCGALATLLLISARAAETPADTPAPEIRRLFRALELPQRFAEARASYLEFMQSQGTAGTKRISAEIGQRLIAADYETPLCIFLAERFSPAEAKEVSDYLETSVGKRQLREANAMLRDMRSAPAGAVNPPQRWANFKEGLTRAEKQTVEAFTATEIGRKYFAEMGPIHTKLSETFSRLEQEILGKMAAEHGHPSPAAKSSP